MEKAAWLEVSLIVDGEMAEAVAEVLARYVTGGVAIESTGVAATAEDEGYAVGPLRVAGYLAFDDQLEGKRRQLEEALWYLGRIRKLPEPVFKPVQETDWSLAWREHYRPVSIGRRLVIVPAWLEAPDPERIPVRIDPGMAFGTGTHPTTQLCLELIDEICDIGRRTKDDGRRTNVEGQNLSSLVLRPSSVIDLGCGSGILAVAALKLGAERALGVDIDLQAIAAARHNAELNGVADRLELGQGSVVEIRSGQFSLKKAPLVLANILAPVLVRLLMEEELADLLAPGGQLVLSGILEDQAADVVRAAEAHGLRLAGRRRSGDWIALLVSA